jgi:hypothetical protein
MPTEGKADYLALRVLDNHTGAEIVHELAHQHDCRWERRALQQGMPGSSTLGTFTIHSPGGPQSDEFRKRWQDQWTQLAIGQRVEGYLGNVVTGSPARSGVVTKIRRSLSGPWEVTGVDSLWMLQQSQMLPGEVFAGPGAGVLPTNGLEIVKALSGTQEVVWDDDFSGWNGSAHPNSSDYILSNFSFTSADPYRGLPALTSTAVGPTDAFAVTTTSWNANQQYWYSVISIHGTMVGGTNAVTSEAGILLLADSTAQNDVLLRAQMIANVTFPGTFDILAQIFSRSAGTYTQQASVTAFSVVRNPFPFEVTAVIYENAGRQELRLLINGKDATAVWNPGSLAPSSGRIGLRFSPGAGGAPAVFVNRIQFHARNGPSLGTAWGTPRFKAGTQSFGAGAISHEIAAGGQTHLDMMLLAASLDGFTLRKNPGPGHKGDSLDYAASPGQDHSGKIVLEEGVNIVADGTEVATVPEMFGTDVSAKAIPGGDSGGSITWGRIGAVGDAVLTDTVTDMGVPGYDLLVNYARSIQGRKANPLQAVQVRVIRDATWLSVNNGAGPRELDFVTVLIPTLGVQRQKVQIMGDDFQEGAADTVVYLSALPESAAPNHVLQRIVRPLDYLSTTYQPR